MNNSKNLRFHRYSHLNHAYSVTFCTALRRPYLLDFNLARTVINGIKFHDHNANTSTIAFVVMPDHVHWLFVLHKRNLTYLMQSIKSYTAHQFGGQLWQKGFYEHQVRKEEDLVKLSRYIVANPLRANLVSNIGDYPFWDAVWLDGYL